MRDVSPNSSIIRVEGDFSGFTPQELFDYFVQPELLVKWWPREARLEPRVGGAYDFRWPEQKWQLTGKYTVFEPGQRLGFTWKWTHEPDTKEVLAEFSPSPEGGAHLVITHSSWTQEQEAQEDRQGVVEGWIHFGMRLAGQRRGQAS